ncbi:MAG: hypothetical protein L6420_07950 [Elusimicrobia bacterium]|nr:hypothetical protein [Elusimicrobiota bacterium]
MNIFTDHHIQDYLTEPGDFEKMMPHRINNILMVASLYDSFLFADDERLTDALFGELARAPEITRVSTAEEALETMGNKKFDLIIAMTQIADTDMNIFAKEIRKTNPDMPLVFLSFNMRDIYNLSDETKSLVNGIFLWSGDTKIFSAIINLIEDEMNFEEDAKVGVQATLLVEDNVKFYSSYLPTIYTELMKQTQIVIADELNPAKKKLRLKARPKVLHASNFNDAWEIYSKYKRNILGVISDIEFPIDGKKTKDAGIILSKRIQEDYPDMPILLQSSNGEYCDIARAVGASFLNKSCADISAQLKNFIFTYFGFGDFVFTDKNQTEIMRAGDIQAMIKTLKILPIDSLLHHASRNHFSKWLFARTEFEIAYHIRPKKISEFKDGEDLRKYLIETLHRFISKTQHGSILKFETRLFNNTTPFSKIGNGSIGGKARGLAFTDFLLSKKDLSKGFENVSIKVPNTITIATDVFDFFIEQNDILSQLNNVESDKKIGEIFEKSRLPGYLRRALRKIIDTLDGPLAVRSSSLLEDSKTQPFAGIYKTYMLANNHPDKEFRFKQLVKAIKYIYASTFSSEAASYRKFSPHLPDEEKMAIIIQNVVGKYYPQSKRYYPDFSGVAQSYNYYPVPPITSDNSIVHIALGLGKVIVEGYNALRFSPEHPHNLHQFSTINDFFVNSQKKIVALNLDLSRNNDADLNYDYEPAIKEIDISGANEDGSLELVGSSYSSENDIICDNIWEKGAKLITFAPILKSKILPLTEILQSIIQMAKETMGTNIEMEFAANYNRKTKTTEFYILQIRPMVSRSFSQKITFDDIKEKPIICSSNLTLGNGHINDVKHIIFVKPEKFNTLKTYDIANQIGKLNKLLKGSGYILIGPGRWGSSDPLLGIPVKWRQISNSKTIVESNYEKFSIDPSYGTHFFHNVTSLGMAYFTINSKQKEQMLDWDWLKTQKAEIDMEYVKLIKVEKALDIRVDGSSGKGIIALTNRG